MKAARWQGAMSSPWDHGLSETENPSPRDSADAHTALKIYSSDSHLGLCLFLNSWHPSTLSSNPVFLAKICFQTWPFCW